MPNQLTKLLQDQLSVWPLATANYRSLKNARMREITLDGLAVRLQHNPARILSTAAEIDEASLKARPCFLCAANRPPEQLSMRFDGRKGREYDITVNPYPIFPSHFVISRLEHVPQSIWHHYVDMADLARNFTDFTIYYNGPFSGASAPDHFHFQACPRHSLPLESEIDRLLDSITVSDVEEGVPNGEEKPEIPDSLKDDIEYISSVQDAQLFHYKHFTRGIFALRARTSKSLAKLFYRLLDCSPVPEGHSEPMFNVLTWYGPAAGSLPGAQPVQGSTHGLSSYEYRAVVALRASLRSHHWFSDGPDHLTLGAGCAEMAGHFVLPEEGDFDKMTPSLLKEVMAEVSISEETEKHIIWRLVRTQPKIEVGILSAPEITFEMISDGAGPQKVLYQEGKICYNGVLYDELYFEAQTMSTLFAEPTFILHDVVIGIGFHWERKVTMKYAGSLKFMVVGGKVQAVNIIGLEDYLLSVISSEMSPSSPLEYLKAHAVISRSWLIAQIRRRSLVKKLPEEMSRIHTEADLVTWLDADRHKNLSPVHGKVIPEICRWQDHSDHRFFDVCADDHCQRYQGLSGEIGETAVQAVDQTWGQVLTYDGSICDARFSKCCGGRTELFSTCWEDTDYPYLQSVEDPWCGQADEKTLSRVMKDYDRQTTDYYEWTVEYDVDTLSELISRRSGIIIGNLEALEALERGPSGRIKKLKVTGSQASFIVGKELEIRQILSDNTLKSSAFDIEFTPGKVILHGRGWGHGVGLCQIGGAVMAGKGFTYRDILGHYYPGAEIKEEK